MARCATNIMLTPNDERVLREWLEVARLQNKRAERARIVLFAAEGRPTEWIAEQLGTRPARVSKWRTRFAKSGFDGLNDSQRSGKPVRRDPASDQRLRDLLAAPAPMGRRAWTAPLLASAAGLDLNYVRRVLKASGIHLRQTSAAASTDLPVHRQAWIAGVMLSRPVQSLAIYSGPPQPLGHFAETGSLTAAVEALGSGPSELHTSPFCRSHVLEHMNRLAGIARIGLVNVIYAAAEEPAGLPALPQVSYHRLPDMSSWLDQAAAWLTVLPAGRSEFEAAAANRITACLRGFLEQPSPAQDRCFEWLFTPQRAGSRRAGPKQVFDAALAG